MVRKGKADKNRVCPNTTTAGVFSYDNDKGIITYSGCPNVDIDDTFKNYGLHPEAVKRLLAGDTFLNFNLLNVSVRGNGVKGILTVQGGIAEEHLLYYSAIEKYILDTYGIKIDPSCRNISRAYYLSYDPDVYYNPEGYVERALLLALLPAPAAATATAAAPATPPYVSTATSVPSFGNSTYSVGERPSDLLNRMAQVIERSKRALKADGWIENGELWRRPGKNGGSSASSTTSNARICTSSPISPVIAPAWEYAVTPRCN